MIPTTNSNSLYKGLRIGVKTFSVYSGIKAFWYLQRDCLINFPGRVQTIPCRHTLENGEVECHEWVPNIFHVDPKKGIYCTHAKIVKGLKGYGPVNVEKNTRPNYKSEFKHDSFENVQYMDVEITGQYYYENGTIFILHGLVYGVEDTKPEYQAAVQNFREK